MRLKMLTTALGPTTELQSGQIYGAEDVTPEMAKQLIDGGYAINLDPAVPEVKLPKKNESK